MDYTPTTEEVRDRFSLRLENSLETYGVRGKWFDRWFAEVKAQEAKAERERIIQILERLGSHGVSHSERCLPRHWIVERAIEEITGETSES